MGGSLNTLKKSSQKNTFSIYWFSCTRDGRECGEEREKEKGVILWLVVYKGIVWFVGENGVSLSLLFL